MMKKEQQEHNRQTCENIIKKYCGDQPYKAEDKDALESMVAYFCGVPLWEAGSMIISWRKKERKERLDMRLDEMG